LKNTYKQQIAMASIFFAIVLLLGAWNLLLAQEAADCYGEDESAYQKVTLVFGIPLCQFFFPLGYIFQASGRVLGSSADATKRSSAGSSGPFIGPIDLVFRILGFFGKNAELPKWMKLQSPDLDV
jgi:hypothetical protein